MSALSVIYQDEHLVAINKPSGMMTHRSKIAERDARSAMETLRDDLGRWVYPAHRLDRATSGALLFALDPDTARALQAQFHEHTVRKSYLMVTRGYPPHQGRVTRPLQERHDRITDRRAKLDKPPQEADTSFEVWARSELKIQLGRYPTTRFSLVAAQPRTGRRHQIRRHLAGLSHPLIGDTSHGRGELNRYFRERFDCHRLALAAISLELKHPVSGLWLSLRAPINGSFARVCHDLFLAPLSDDGSYIGLGVHSSADSSSLPKMSRDWLTDPEKLRALIASFHA